MRKRPKNFFLNIGSVMRKGAKNGQKAQYIVEWIYEYILHVVIKNYSKKVLTKGVAFAIITPVAARERTKRWRATASET